MRLNMAKFALTGVKVVARIIAQNATWETAGPAALADAPPFNLPPLSFTGPAADSNPQSTKKSAVALASTSDTVEELRRRLGKELYRVELDLQGGGRIGGKPCDCLSRAKHSAGIEATAEELMSYEVNPLYGKVIQWVNDHAPVFEPAEIANHPPEFYQAMAPEIRAFRKAVMGTEKLSAMISPQDREKVIAKAQEIIKQRMEDTE